MSEPPAPPEPVSAAAAGAQRLAFALAGIALAAAMVAGFAESFGSSGTLPHVLLDPLWQGQRNFDAGRYAQAAREFRRARTIQPADAASHAALATTLAQLPSRTEAEVARERLAAARRAAELAPDNDGRHFDLGAALADAGLLEEAVVALRRSIELAPGRADSHANLGAALFLLDRPAEAIAPLERALEIESQHPSATRALRRARIAVARQAGGTR